MKKIIILVLLGLALPALASVWRPATHDPDWDIFITERPHRLKVGEVIVFADRIEVWNPGELPPELTPDLLRKPHGPIPRNPLIAEPLFRVKYIEKAGTGTTDMIADCRETGDGTS